MKGRIIILKVVLVRIIMRNLTLYRGKEEWDGGNRLGEKKDEKAESRLGEKSRMWNLDCVKEER